jgi:hypothetical protein
MISVRNTLRTLRIFSQRTIPSKPLYRYYSQDKQVDKDYLAKLIASREDLYLIDVRTKPETESTDLPLIHESAKNLPRM